MTATGPDQLFRLLPEIYRIRDAESGDHLKALLTVIGREAEALEEDISGLYNNLFIETCDEWVVPYIGDLLGTRLLYTVPSAGFSLRGYVANTLAYRRRKGTATVLEQLARDVTGWPARVVEFYRLLAMTQHLNHVRPAFHSLADMHDRDVLELIGGPFERTAHSADVRHISRGRGRYNIPSIGIFLWRIMSFPIVKGRAYKIEDAKNRWYMFSPIGLPVHLFNNPRTEREITHIAKEVNLPVELRIQALSDELELICQDPAYQDAADYFGEFPVFSVYRDGELTEVAKIRIADLSDWTIPADLDATVELVVDPVIGRLFFTQGTTSAVTVSYSYGFPGQTGGGPYTRPDALVLPDPVNTREKSWNLPGTGPKTLAGTLAGWETWMPAVPDTRAIITLTDSLTHAAGDGLVIDFCGRKKGTLIIQAADEERPVIDGSITIRGSSPDCSLTVSGLLIHGTITIEPGSVGSLTLTHCTLTPGGRLDPKTLCPETGEPSIHFASPASGNEVTEITLDHCITGALCLPPERTRLSVTDSIIQACPPQEALPVAISGENGSTGPASDIRRTTILGHVRTRELYASGVIFNDSVMVEKDQEGCVRYSHVPHGSITPRRFRCQPDLALARETKLHTLAGRVFTDSEINDVISRMAPSFTSVLYHDSGYCQLGRDCVPGLTNGGEDGSEMGAYSFLLQPQREANLRAVLDEYLRFGLEAGIFYIP